MAPEEIPLNRPDDLKSNLIARTRAAQTWSHFSTFRLPKLLPFSRSANLIAAERDNFKNLFKLSPEMVCVLSGPHHLFEFVNDAHIRALGFDATEKPFLRLSLSLLKFTGS